jgi:spore coat protein U-like protein
MTAGGIWQVRIVATVTIALLSVAEPAQAATCIVSPQSVNFGPYDTFNSAPSDTVASITVVCDVEVAFGIALEPGTGSYADRTMRAGADRMVYTVHRSPAHHRLGRRNGWK